MPRGVFVSICRLVVPLSSIRLTLVQVVVGAVIYGVVLLKLDQVFMTNFGRWRRRWVCGCRGGCRRHSFLRRCLANHKITQISTRKYGAAGYKMQTYHQYLVCTIIFLC